MSKAAKPDVAARKLMDRLASDRAVVGRVRGLLATTYEFDPDFFETDFLPALFGLGAWEDRSWTSRIAIERELALMDAACIVMEAGRYLGRPRTLRIELIPYHAPGRALHAKVVLIVYERAVRFLVTSANLTLAGYRDNREAAAVLSAMSDETADVPLIRSALKAMPRALLQRLDEGGRRVIDMALESLAEWAPAAAASNVWFDWGGDETPTWRHFIERLPVDDRVERLTVVSPFWSEEAEAGPVQLLLSELRDRGRLAPAARVRLITEAQREPLHGELCPQLPPSYMGFSPDGIDATIVAQGADPTVLPDEVGGRDDFAGTRRLHAKVVVAHGAHSTLAYFGSGNFTRRGWGFVGDQQYANIEAGVLALRTGAERRVLDGMIPQTAGKEVVLADAKGGELLAPPEGPAKMSWPDFVQSIVLEPSSADPNTLELVVHFEERPEGWSWSVSMADGDATSALLVGDGCARESRMTPDALQLRQLLLERQVTVRWPGCADGCAFPLNVSHDARYALPVAPDDRKPDELRLLSYYQGRLTWEEMFDDPSTPAEEAKLRAELADVPSGVDTSRIQSYQVRAFVEALHGIGRDLKSSAVSEAAIRLAVRGPVSPLALGREVMRQVSVSSRSPTAGAFQLVEICAQLDGARTHEVRPRLADFWSREITDCFEQLMVLLTDLRAAHPMQLGPSTAFDRYCATLLGKRNKGRA